MLLARDLRLGPQRGRVVALVDLVDGEVRDVDVGVELWLEGGADLAEVVPDHTAEERVVLDLLGAAGPAEAVGGVAQETGGVEGQWVDRIVG